MNNTFNNTGNFPTFRYWCYKVLPLVYDDSLSYYEVLSKVFKYINDIIESEKVITGELQELKTEIDEIKKVIDTYDKTFAEKIIKECIATMIFVEITETGYIVFNIPSNWSNIVFNTTGLDINLEQQQEYGHLVLSY